MTATTLPKSDQPEFKLVHANDLPPELRTQMERIVFDHTAAHRDEYLDIEVTLRSGQAMADYKHEIDLCPKCGDDRPAINIDLLRLKLQQMLGAQG